MESKENIDSVCEVMVPKEMSENSVGLQPEAAESATKNNLANDEVELGMDTTEDKVSRKEEVLDSVVRNKQAHFKSQQRGDPDLSVEEKKKIAENLLTKSPPGFLSRFGHLLSKKHLDYFHTFEYHDDKERGEVEYHLSYLGASSSKSSKTKIKNRRYDALQKMIQSGSYFSMDEMQARNPLLFDQLVGKYQSDKDKQPDEVHPSTDGEFSWMQHFAKEVEKERMEKLKQQQKLDEIGDEDDSSDEPEKQIPKEKEEGPASLWGEYKGKFQADTSSQKKKKKSIKKEENLNLQDVSEEEKAFYLQEFQNAMYHSFLCGNDKDFDYSSVDNNSEYDCVDMRERDEQDQYFDKESPDSISQADVDMMNGPDELAQFCEAPVLSDSATPSDAMEEDVSDVSNRLTEDDVRNLKSFASSWAHNHTPSKSDSAQERTSNPTINSGLSASPKPPAPSHKVPVKKNHKIKINLKTSEM